MKRYINTYNALIGFHRYPNAPEWCQYLSNRHRHVFVIRCSFEVSHNEREIEINQQQLEIDKYLSKKYGYPCEFGDMSCESIAEELLQVFPQVTKVQVLEDNYGGSTLTK